MRDAASLAVLKHPDQTHGAGSQWSKRWDRQECDECDKAHFRKRLLTKQEELQLSAC